MLSILSALRTQFDERLLEKAIPRKTQWSYIKWLRYYLNFCRKYDFHKSNRGSLPLFLKKLEGKRETRAQLQQAADAITFPWVPRSCVVTHTCFTIAYRLLLGFASSSQSTCYMLMLYCYLFSIAVRAITRSMLLLTVTPFLCDN